MANRTQVPRVLIVCFCSNKLNLRQLFSVDFEPSMVRILLEGQQFFLAQNILLGLAVLLAIANVLIVHVRLKLWLNK
ncbi:hypothetical protein C0J52_16678 [Blattella germanica]|nr:hypothetical protein C0J52_16678 [Blattella germanica]